MKKHLKTLLLFIVLACAPLAQAAGTLSIAAAADLRFAMDEIVKHFQAAHPNDKIDVTYGSSGKFHSQIQQGAPYDLFFSADIGLPKELVQSGIALSPVVPYALGRIVLWSPVLDASKMTLMDLATPEIRKVAIANPQHAPYGKRAEEALRTQGIWGEVSAKAVFGENISQTAQFVETGNADIGIIALSLALNPTIAAKGGYYLIPETLHAPLDQGFVIIKRAAENPLAKSLASYMTQKEARTIMSRYGFTLPPAATDK